MLEEVRVRYCSLIHIINKLCRHYFCYGMSNKTTVKLCNYGYLKREKQLLFSPHKAKDKDNYLTRLGIRILSLQFRKENFFFNWYSNRFSLRVIFSFNKEEKIDNIRKK
jgi:hypothetical protein